MRLQFLRSTGSSLTLGVGLLTGSLVCDVHTAADLIVVEREQIITLKREQVEESFLRNVFRNHKSVSEARKTAERALDMQIEDVAQIGTLSDGQRAKLELAGQGDICRFFNEFHAIVQSAPLGPLPKQQWQQAWQETQKKLPPLQMQYNAGLHGDGSLFRKTIPSALNSDQLQTFQKMDGERNRKHYRALVLMSLARIDRTIRLPNKRREQIVDVVMEKTTPPPALDQSKYQLQLVLFKMSQIQDDLRPLFSDSEWTSMLTILRQGQALEQMLQEKEQLIRGWDLQRRGPRGGSCGSTTSTYSRKTSTSIGLLGNVHLILVPKLPLGSAMNRKLLLPTGASQSRRFRTGHALRSGSFAERAFPSGSLGTRESGKP